MAPKPKFSRKLETPDSIYLAQHLLVALQLLFF